MFEEVAEIAVAIALAFDMTITVALAIIAIKWHRKYQFLKTENDLMVKKVSILKTGNDLLKDMINDLKKMNAEEGARYRAAVGENKELAKKLDSTQKKLLTFSKMINDMKNS